MPSDRPFLVPELVGKSRTTLGLREYSCHSPSPLRTAVPSTVLLLNWRKKKIIEHKKNHTHVKCATKDQLLQPLCKEWLLVPSYSPCRIGQALQTVQMLTFHLNQLSQQAYGVYFLLAHSILNKEEQELISKDLEKYRCTHHFLILLWRSDMRIYTTIPRLSPSTMFACIAMAMLCRKFLSFIHSFFSAFLLKMKWWIWRGLQKSPLPFFILGKLIVFMAVYWAWETTVYACLHLFIFGACRQRGRQQLTFPQSLLYVFT